MVRDLIPYTLLALFSIPLLCAASRWQPMDTGVIIPDVLFTIRTRNNNFFILNQDNHIICIDAGYRNTKKINVPFEFEKLGINPDSVECVFLTHTDMDHTGGLDLIRNAKIYLGSAEEQMITRKTARMGLYYNKILPREYVPLEDGEIVNIGSIKVQTIFCPGHTPGSVSYLVNDSILFTGDNLRLENGKVHIFFKAVNMDSKRQGDSIMKLAKFTGIKLMCTAHTGCSNDFDKAFEGWR